MQIINNATTVDDLHQIIHLSNNELQRVSWIYYTNTLLNTFCYLYIAPVFVVHIFWWD